MKKILFGTANPAKITQVRAALALVGITVDGLDERIASIKIIKDGQTALQNAQKKAVTYALAAGQPVFGMDNALYFDGLSLEEQPGLFVRRRGRNGERLDDAQMIIYYSDVIARLGSSKSGWWEFAICVAGSQGIIAETIIKSLRNFVSIASRMINPGYPLDSLQIDALTGKYISEMSNKERNNFWERMIGAPLAAFVHSIEL